MQIEDKEVDLICEMVMDLCGIRLDASKKYLIENRLGPVANEYQCRTFQELAKVVCESGNGTLHNRVIDAITVNETLFFRDRDPFRVIAEDIVPEIRKLKGTQPVRIWCAACSTGQEPYSIAIALSEALGELRSPNVRILATDISDAALATAEAGRYLPHEVERGLPAGLLKKYFVSEGSAWRVTPKLRSLVEFRKVNLHSSFASLGKFDIVLCRNVSIYFSDQGRLSLFRRIKSQLFDHGHLFVGSSEILNDVGSEFKPIRVGNTTVYRPNSNNQDHKLPGLQNANFLASK